MPPLLIKPAEMRPDRLHYLGVSFGLTAELHKFWKRAGFTPVYLRQTANDLTGEHTCIMLRHLEVGGGDSSWLGAFANDFQRRFLALLARKAFRVFPAVLALSIDQSASSAA